MSENIDQSWWDNFFENVPELLFYGSGCPNPVVPPSPKPPLDSLDDQLAAMGISPDPAWSDKKKQQEIDNLKDRPAPRPWPNSSFPTTQIPDPRIPAQPPNTDPTMQPLGPPPGAEPPSAPPIIGGGEIRVIFPVQDGDDPKVVAEPIFDVFGLINYGLNNAAYMLRLACAGNPAATPGADPATTPVVNPDPVITPTPLLVPKGQLPFIPNVPARLPVLPIDTPPPSTHTGRPIPILPRTTR